MSELNDVVITDEVLTTVAPTTEVPTTAAPEGYDVIIYSEQAWAELVTTQAPTEAPTEAPTTPVPSLDVIAPVAVEGLIHDDEPHDLVTWEGQEGVTMLYKLGEGGYSETIPQGTEAGEYSVIWTASSKTYGLNAPTTGEVTVVIEPSPVEKVEAAIEAAHSYIYTESDPETGEPKVSYEYKGTFVQDGVNLNYTINVSSIGERGKNIMNDLARFVGAYHWSEAQINDIVVDNDSYVWDDTLDLKGSRFVSVDEDPETHEHKTLVDVITHGSFGTSITTDGVATLTFSIYGVKSTLHAAVIAE